MQPTEVGRDDAMLMNLEGKMFRLTHDIPNLLMDRIPIEMQEHVVRVPPTWLRLLQKVSRCVICYKEVVVDAAEAPTSP